MGCALDSRLRGNDTRGVRAEVTDLSVEGAGIHPCRESESVPETPLSSFPHEWGGKGG